MKITELKPEDEIIFEITFGSETHEFKSKVLEIKSDFIVANPIRAEGKVLSFSSASVPTNLVYKREEKAPIVWKQVAITVVSYKKNTVYKIMQSMDGREMNRRGSYRLYVGVEGVVQLGSNHKAVDVLVKDISEGGFAFICSENLDDTDSRGSVHLVFKDQDKTIGINGIIVRKIEVAPNRFLYGCIINLKTPLVAQYINQKQRERIAQQKAVKMISGGTRAGMAGKRGSNEVDKAEALLDKRSVNIDRDRYSKDLLDEGRKSTSRSIDREKYRNVKF
ncbi:MAG: PilZ domain-containing protein [Lachnospiraceae bacterium]